jgi:hypothetical protein
VNPTWIYVAAVYAAAIAIARRMGVVIPRRVAALFYLLVLLFLFRPMTGPYVNMPTDVLKLMPPWSAVQPGFTKNDVSNYELQDVVMQMAPWAHQVRESWLSLKPPLWNAQSGSGVPLLANMQSEGLSPLRLLVVLLPTPYLMTAQAALKMLVALTFTYLFCRRRYDLIPSVIAAIAFGFGTWTVTWLHFALGSIGAFLPAVLHQIDLLAERRTFGRVVFAAALGPCILFTGHPETTGHITFYAVLYALWIAFENARRTSGVALPHGSESRTPDARSPTPAFAASLAIAAALAALLCAPVLATFLETMRKTVRYENIQNEPYHGTAFSDFPSMIATLQPRFFGTRPGPTWGPAGAESICGFAGFLGIAAWFGLLARAILRKRYRDFEMFLIVASVLIYGLMDDWPVIGPPFRALFALALNARLRLMFCLLAAVMTGALIHHATRDRRLIAPTIAGGAAVLALFFAKTHFPSADAKSFALQAILPSAIAVAAAALLLVRRGAVLVGIAVFAELWITAHHWNPIHPIESFYPHTPMLGFLEHLRRPVKDPYRIAGIGAPLFPNTHVFFGVEDARVMEPIASARYAQVLRDTMKYDTSVYYPPFSDPGAPILDYLNIRWLLTERGAQLDPGRYQLRYDDKDGKIWENMYALPRFFAPRNVFLVPDYSQLATHRDWANTAYVTRLPNDKAIDRDLLHPRPANAPDAKVTIVRGRGDEYELRTHAPRHALVVSSISFWPGWRVKHNGRTLEPLLVNGAFLGFIVPPGEGTVHVRYFPASFWGGAALSLATVVALIIAARRR